MCNPRVMAALRQRPGLRVDGRRRRSPARREWLCWPMSSLLPWGIRHVSGSRPYASKIACLRSAAIPAHTGGEEVACYRTANRRMLAPPRARQYTANGRRVRVRK
jgi:hypothetical protein